MQARMTPSTFRELHHRPDFVLILPNAWDAASARLVELAGAAAIATSSAAVAWAHGRADGEELDVATVLGVVREIVRVVRLPVSVDLEAGYSVEPAGIARVIGAILDAGAVGINLEDGAGDPERLAAKITVAKETAERAGHDLFVNARTDVYLRNLASGEAAVAETLRRARLYRDAGADGIFVPGVVAPEAITAIAGGTALPLNVLARPTLAPVAELGRCGVRRLSVGCALAQAALDRVRGATRELIEHGTYASLYAGSIPVAELNGWFR
jgi:2-methylisocitrate lyase-like PEP mutase family enzyme